MRSTTRSTWHRVVETTWVLSTLVLTVAGLWLTVISTIGSL